MKRKKANLYKIYYIAIIMSLLGMTSSFMEIDTHLPFLKISIVLIIFLGILGIRYKSRRIKQTDFIVVLSLLFSSSFIFLKMLRYDNIFFIAPIMAIACFMMVINVITYSNKFNYRIYMVINILGMIGLMIAIKVNGSYEWGALQIGYTNPQTIASWALVFAMSLIPIYDFYADLIKHRIFFFIILAVFYIKMLHVTVITEARFATVILFIVPLLRILKPIKILNNKIVRISIAFMPLIITFLLELFYKIGAFSNMSGNSMLNGREQIWKDWIDKVLETPLTGINYFSVNANTFYSHNLFVDYCVLFGIIITMVFFMSLAYVFVFKVPRFNTDTKAFSRLKYDSFVMFVLILLSSIVEGCMFTVGAGGIFVFSFAPLMVSTSHISTINRRKL